MPDVSVRGGLWLVWVAALSFLLGFGFYAASPRITEASYAAIREGMTSDEVERVLGAPPGNYARGPLYATCMIGGPPDAEMRKWSGDEGTIYLWFDSQDRVVTKAFNVEGM